MLKRRWAAFAALLLLGAGAYFLYQMVYKGDAEEQRQQEDELAEEETGRGDYMEFFEQQAQENGELRVAVIGSSVARGMGASSTATSWAGLLKSDLESREELSETTITFGNFGMNGYKANDLLEQGIVDSLIQARPDFIVFETSVINSYRQGEALDTTVESIDTLMKQLEAELPEAEIVVISPNPLETSSANIRGNTYLDYLTETQEHIIENEWNYVDSYTEIEAERQEQGYDIDDILDDGVHPNDTGYSMWYNVLERYLF